MNTSPKDITFLARQKFLSKNQSIKNQSVKNYDNINNKDNNKFNRINKTIYAPIVNIIILQIIILSIIESFSL